ncbi:MAG: exopolysaccharide biosynthesis polyprenyl glycosylphosphotransferase [Acidobacteriaceae bacterium]
MRVCGKSLPPGAALLLGSNVILLCFAIPALLTFLFFSSLPTFQWYEPVYLMLRLIPVGMLCSVVFYYHELYNLQVLRSTVDTLWRLLQGTAVVLLLLAFFYTLMPSLNPGEARLLLLILISTITILLARHFALPHRQERVLIVGSSEEFNELCEVIATSSEWNLKIVKLLDTHTALTQEDWPDNYDHVIVSGGQPYQPLLLSRLLQLKMQGLRIEDSFHFYERTHGRVGVAELTPEWFVFSSGFENGERKRLVKRYMDIVLTLLLLIVTLPLMAIVSLLIWIESGRPVLFCQDRVGLYGKTFRIFKFRTMRPCAPNEQPQWTSNQDNRITRLGTFLRKFRLDELPQLFNVLRGDMSLVGPRPEQPYFCGILAEAIPYYNQRHSVPPGLTGWAQVRYHYGASVEESRRKLEYDLFYVKHLSLALDLAILIETVKVVLVGRGAK